jgi:hypothetical protein
LLAASVIFLNAGILCGKEVFKCRGIPTGIAKTFKEFALSGEGKRDILKRGMLPYGT